MSTSIDPLYILDTNILIHYVRRKDLQQQIEAKYRLQVTPTVPLVSYVTEAELRSIAVQNAWGKAKMDQLGFLLSLFRIIPIERPEIMDAYILIDAYSVKKGYDMGKNDLWVAATARATSAILLTTDKDFDHLSPSFLIREWIDPNSGRP